MQVININSKERNEFIDITSQVKEAVEKTSPEEGLCVVFCPHTTAAITINENADFSVQKDISGYLKKLVPTDNGYLHAEGNSDSHIKSSLVGASCQIIIEKGKIALGTWQGIYFCEFDGPRKRKIYVKIIKEH